MKYLQFLAVFFIAFSVAFALPIESEQSQKQYAAAATLLQIEPSTQLESNHQQTVATLPLTLLDVENADKSGVDSNDEAQRTARGLGFGGLGGLGGLGLHKFGLGFKGGFGGLGLGGLHGLGGGWGFKPLFFKHFG